VWFSSAVAAQVVVRPLSAAVAEVAVSFSAAVAVVG
jgi:hypothetical protein